MTLTTKTDTSMAVAEAPFPASKSSNAASSSYSIEFFHIYTDEKISGRHLQGLEYLRAIEKAWDFAYSRVVLIDNYNPKVHITTANDVLRYLDQHQMLPDFWACEADMVDNALTLLNKLSDKKLKKQYLRYIEQHQKYPCSLLTAAWYLTRLGHLDYTKCMHSTTTGQEFVPAKRLFNLLPYDYKNVEDRAEALIRKSEYSSAVHQIQDLFYPVDAGRVVDLF